MKDSILIKGNKYGLTIIIDEESDFNIVEETLYKKLNDSRKFFGNSKVSLTFEGKTLSSLEQKKLIDTIESASDLNVLCILDSKKETEKSEELLNNLLYRNEALTVKNQEESTDIKKTVLTETFSNNEHESLEEEQTESLVEDLKADDNLSIEVEDITANKPTIEIRDSDNSLLKRESSSITLSKDTRNILVDKQKTLTENKLKISNLLPENSAIFHYGTLRSGQEVVSDRSVVVMGNVHYGASVSARGNVIVIGKLNGCVHAGKDGNENAFVVALNMSPTQLRIANVFGRAPDKKAKKILANPQIAYVEQERIVIENITRNIYDNMNFNNY